MRRSHSPRISDDALIFLADHVFVPIVRDDRLHLQQVTLGHDDGINVEVIGKLVTSTSSRNSFEASRPELMTPPPE